MAERVAAGVPVRRGIGEFSDADAVEDNPNHSVEWDNGSHYFLLGMLRGFRDFSLPVEPRTGIR